MTEENLKYRWQHPVFDALIEYHPDRQRDRIAEAEKAVTMRLLQRPTDVYELLALRDALLTLRILFCDGKPGVERSKAQTKCLVDSGMFPPR
jgi:hypothetical protein